MTGAPLTARSVLASLLLGTTPPKLPGRALVRAAGCLGVAEGTARVALSRMVGAGELAASDGCYELAGPLLERRARQEEGRRPPTRRWDGTWVMVVAGASGLARPASERASVRRRLAGLRLAEWREGVWLRPDNLSADRRPIDGCTWVVGARPVAEGLAAGLWDLGGWSVTAWGLLAAMEATPAADLVPAFALAAAVVRHVRDDPLLPAELLPPEWPGETLRRAYERYQASFQRALAGAART